MSLSVVQDLTTLDVRLLGSDAARQRAIMKPYARRLAKLYRLAGQFEDYPTALHAAWAVCKRQAVPR